MIGIPLMRLSYLNLPALHNSRRLKKVLHSEWNVISQTGYSEKVIIDAKNKKKIPVIRIADKNGDNMKQYTLPVGAYISINDGDHVTAGQKIVKIPRKLGKIQDITGGLPRVTELFEARNPSNPAVVAEIDGIVSFGKIKRGNREVMIEDEKTGQKSKYLIGLSKHLLVQEGDFVRSGTPITDGTIAARDILHIKGPYAVQSHLVDGVQEVLQITRDQYQRQTY